MKKQIFLIGALMLSLGLPAVGGFTATAEPAPQMATATTLTSINGSIVDENGEAVVGASVQEKGSNRGTASDLEGRFAFRGKEGSDLTISYVGYKTVTVKAGTGITVTLEPDNALLDELVVVGYGTQRRVNLTGAVSTVDMDKAVGSRPVQDLDKALQGAAPGLTVLNASGNLQDNPTLKIRGIGTISRDGSGGQPLIVVDGVPTTSDALSMLNTSDIESVSVLKDAASASIYGTQAAFGVILITTKKAEKGDKVQVKYTNNFAWDHATMLPQYPDVPTQLEAVIYATQRAKMEGELFGMKFTDLLPYAQAWKEQNGSKKLGNVEMRPYVDGSNVGDYRFVGSQPLYYADYDVAGIWYNSAAPSQSHNVSVQGSSGRTTFYTSFGYANKQDLYEWNPGRRHKYNAAANLQTDVTDWLTVGTRISFARRHFSRAEPWGQPLMYLWRWGSYFIPSGTIDGNDFRYIAMHKQASRRTIVTDLLRLNAYVKANVTKDITINADFTYDIQNQNTKWADAPRYGMNWSGTAPTQLVGASSTEVERRNYKYNKWTANAYANYAKTFNEDHNLNVMLGVTGSKYYSDEFSAKKTAPYDPNYAELNLTSGEMKDATITSATGDGATAGYFGRINYDYKGIYLLELNGRYDGSSQMSWDSHWAFFPSMSLGYRFSEENYFAKAKEYVSNGKLRFSYGSIGNDNIGEGMYFNTISAVSSNYIYWLNNAGSKVIEFGMPAWNSTSLKWERVTTADIGIDLGFLKDQLNVGFDWYQRNTSDIIAPGYAMPASVGSSAPLVNAGTLRTRGWELLINWHKQFNKDFGLNAMFSIGDSKSKVTKWFDNQKNIGYPAGLGSGYSSSEEAAFSHAYVGETWGDIWGFETDRYFTEDDFIFDAAGNITGYKDGVADQTGLQTQGFVFGPGDIKYKDLNGDGVIDGGDGTEDNPGDLKVIGNTLPRYEYSFSVGGNYKGFDFSILFQGVGKRDMWKTSVYAMPLSQGASSSLFDYQTDYNKWYGLGDERNNVSQSNSYPSLYWGDISGVNVSGNVNALNNEKGSNNYYPQTKFLIDMSYLRIKNITLGYTLPAEITRKAFIEALRIYASVDNLALLHKGNKLPVDPEINQQLNSGDTYWGSTWPIARTWSFGLQVTF